MEQKLVNTIATTTFLFNHVHTRNHFALGFRVIPVAKRYGFDMRVDLTKHARTVDTTDFAQFRQVVFIQQDCNWLILFHATIIPQPQ